MSTPLKIVQSLVPLGSGPKNRSQYKRRFRKNWAEQKWLIKLNFVSIPDRYNEQFNYSRPFIGSGWVRTENLRVLADLTQQLYLEVPSCDSVILEKIRECERNRKRSTHWKNPRNPSNPHNPRFGCEREFEMVANKIREIRLIRDSDVILNIKKAAWSGLERYQYIGICLCWSMRLV